MQYSNGSQKSTSANV